MKKWSNRFLIVLIIAFVSTAIMPFLPSDQLIPVIAAIVLACSLYYSRGLSQKFGLAMVILGSLVLWWNKADLAVWQAGITSNVALISLIMVVPILSIPIHLGEYDVKLAQFATRYNKKPQTLFAFLSGAFMILGPITNLGAIHILHSMLERLKLPNSFLARSYVRGFTSINTWAPYFMSVFLVVYSIGIPMSTFLPFGLLLSMTQIIVANVLFTFREVQTIDFIPMSSTLVEEPKKLLEVLLVIIGLTAVIFFFENTLPINTSAIIIVVVLVFSLGWSIFLKRPNQFFKEAKQFRNGMMNNSANEVTLLLSAGFFAVALSLTVLSDHINALWLVVGNYSIMLLILGTITLVALLSLVGVHQIVSISSIIASVSYEAIGMEPVVLAMTMLAAWAASTTISPITPLNVVVSNLLKENVFTIIFKWNFSYSIWVALVHTILIYTVHLFL